MRLISFFLLSLPKALEDGSSSSSGSSSGYGSQNAVKIEEKNPGKNPDFWPFLCMLVFLFVLSIFCVCSFISLGFTTSTTTPSSRIDNYCTYRHYNSPPVFSKLRPSHFTLQSPSVSLRHQHTPPIVENIISDHYCHRNRTLRRSDSYSPGLYPNTVQKNLLEVKVIYFQQNGVLNPYYLFVKHLSRIKQIKSLNWDFLRLFFKHCECAI